MEALEKQIGRRREPDGMTVLSTKSHLRLGPNAGLIGEPNGRLRLNTPALILDLDILEVNIAGMARAAREFRVKLRPHAKCHKSVKIAKMQIAEGASGICCATIGEAEVMAAAGVSDIVITSPLVSDEKIARVIAIAGQGARIIVVTDNPLHAEKLSEACEGAGRRIGVLIDVDAGMQRTGVASHKMALVLAEAVRDLPGLEYLGVQCYAGHIQHIKDAAEREKAALSVMGGLKVLCEELNTHDLAPEIVSGSGTGTFDVDAGAGVLTELQVGSYVFMDAQYNRVWSPNGEAAPFDVSLFVQAAVISANHAGGFTCDAGLKHFAVDGGAPVFASGPVPVAKYEYCGDEHGRITLADGAGPLALGDRIEFIAPHCDPTVNLFDFMHCVRGEALVDIWPIDARGA